MRLLHALFFIGIFVTTQAYATVYEDAEDGDTSGWWIYDTTPAGASIDNIFSEAKGSNVIQFSGEGWQNGYILGNFEGRTGAWNNGEEHILRWSMNFDHRFVIYIRVMTEHGARYLYYTPINRSLGKRNRKYIHIGLGTRAANGTWQTFTRDLAVDLKRYEPDNELLAVNAFLVRGNGMVDDIELSKSGETVYEDAEDGDTGRWWIYDTTPAGASIDNIFSEARGSNVIQFSGEGTKNGYILGNFEGRTGAWNNGAGHILRWSMNFDHRFVIYIRVMTEHGARYLYYTPINRSLGKRNRRYIHIGLGTRAANGTWQTFTRDLVADLKKYEPGNELIAINGFLVRGNGMVDDIKLMESDQGISEDARLLSECTVYISPDAGEAEEYAANELISYIRQATDIELIETTSYDSDSSPCFVIGSDNDYTDAKQLNFSVQELGEDGFQLRRDGNSLLIAGATGRGTLYGVYQYLRDYFDIEWYGLYTTKVPDNSDLQYVPFPTGGRTFVPRFRYREVFNPEAGDPADGDDGAEFATRIMLNGELGHKIGLLDAAHGYGTKTINAFNIRTYPASNPNTLNRALTSLTDNVGTARYDGNNGLLYARITHIDGSSHGWNEADQNLVQENGGAKGTPLVYLTQQVADRILNDDTMNNVLVLSSAYLWSLQPPTQLVLPDNAGVSFAPIEADWSRALDQGGNTGFYDYLTEWSNHAHHIWSWLYSTNFAGYLQPLPNIYPMIDNIKLFANVPESEGMFIQDSYSTRGGSFAALHAWVYARLMWDPTLDGDQLVQEFCNGYYGPDAGPIIHEYIQKLHQSAAETGDFIGTKTRPNLPYLNARFIIEADRLMQEAEDNAASIPLYLKHVQIERMGVDWVMLLNYAQLQKEAQIQGLSWPDAGENDRLARLERLRATVNEVASMDNLGESTGRTNDILDALQQPAVVPENICPQIGFDDASCLDFQDIGFELSEASITSDQNASDHRSAFISGDTVNYDNDGNGTGVWGIQVSLQTLLPANSSEKWDIFARVRIEINHAAGFTSESDVPAFKAGISPGDYREYPVREFGDEQYHIIKVVGGPQSYNAQKSVWFSPPDKQRQEPSSIINLYVDRVFAIKHITPSNIFQLRYFMLFDDDAVMSNDPLSNETYVARMNSGHTAWAIQARLSDLLPDGRNYDIYASIKLGKDAINDGTVLHLGINGNGINNTKAVQANELSSSEYRLIKLPGTNYNRSQVSENGENPKIWFQPASETSGVFYIDKLTIVPVDDQGNSQITPRQASAFLSHATFGATQDDIDALVQTDNYEQWLDEQFAQSATYHMVWGEQNIKGINGTPDLKDNLEDWKTHADTLSYAQQDIWWHIVTKSEDQLRQRMAFALSEIMVISKYGTLINGPDSRLSYYDVLVKNALGNFRNLIEDVTYHPSMGKYLSYRGNAKADPATGTHPDENYAREIMQLFTIGLYQLNSDGTLKLDGNNNPIATYTQQDVREMARVFTGLSDQNGFFFAGDGGSSHRSRTEPMGVVDQEDENYHDDGEKHILGYTIPAGGDAVTDIGLALDILFNHPNTGPFIARQLIQRLVTSNPSPAYVARVAAAFNDNGEGVRGDMQAVVKAILLDDEALHGPEQYPETFGKFREPLLYISHLFRAFNAEDAINTLNVYDGGPSYRYRSYHFHGTGYTRQEAPMEALTVFNYYTPEDGPYVLKNDGLVAPELEVYGKEGIDDVLMGLINKNGFIYRLYEVAAELQIDQEISWIEAKNYDALLNHLDTLLTGGHLSSATKTAIKNYLISREDTNDDEGNPLAAEKLARYTIGLVMTSPDYALQR